MSLEKTTSETLPQNEFSENLYKDDSAEAEHLPEKGEVEAQEEKENLNETSVIQKEEEENTEKAEEKVNEDEEHVGTVVEKVSEEEEKTVVKVNEEEEKTVEKVSEKEEKTAEKVSEGSLEKSVKSVEVSEGDEDKEKPAETEQDDKSVDEIPLEENVDGGEVDIEHLIEKKDSKISAQSFALENVVEVTLEDTVKEAQDTVEEIEIPIKKKKLKKKKIPMTAGSSRRTSDYSSIQLDDNSDLLITGDFLISEHHKPLIPSTASEYDEEEEEEDEEMLEDVPEMSAAERLEYCDKYDRLMKEYDEEKAKNDELLRRLANYYKRKKMYHVLHEGKVHLDAQKKYEKQLDEFGKKAESSKQEQKYLEAEISELRQRCETQEKQTLQAFEKLQHDEHEVGKEIINSEAGRGYEEKHIERYLKRQKIQLNNLIKIRYNFIKMRNKLNETLDALAAIDNLGSNLHLIDYEQLKLDNRNLHDKLEERDSELTRVRLKCQNAVQILAHRREKTAAMETDIAYLNERLEGVSGEFEDVREQLNQLKMERDGYRAAINKIKIKSGLLSRPKLLIDLDNTMREMDDLSNNLAFVKQECFDVSNKVKKIKANMASESKIRRIRHKMEGKDLFQSFSISDIQSFAD